MFGFRFIKTPPTTHVIKYSDGIEQDFIEFNYGTKATILISQRKGRLVV